MSKPVAGPSRKGPTRGELRGGPAQGKSRGGATQGAPRGGTAQHESRGKPTKRAQRTGPTQRQLRVAEEIRHVLAGVFARHEIRDPELATMDITVTEVRLGPDLKHATAFVARLGREDVDVLLPALKRAAPFLRTQVARLVQLKFAPDLHFQPDRALDYASKIDRLLHSPKVAQDLG